MTTILDFAVVTVPLTLAVLALLVLGRRHIHGQMKEIVEAAQARGAPRSQHAIVLKAAEACTREAPSFAEYPPMQDTASQAS
jgi:hypothetical protein